MPKRQKYRKSQRGKIRGKANKGNTVAFGEYGLQSTQAGWINSRQIEAGRITSAHFLKGSGKVHIRIFPHKTVTATPQETRMGKGKGEPEYYVACVKPGTVLYEIGGVPKEVAKQVMNRISHKMPVRCRFVERREE
ncbi:50S ribosomal protein L16 [Candidatus Uabimicrobium amorphum]|uniref:Large ribosomal subunit protein uL16 n=2 Tax=Uabimicrobium amorphum TaxID=2596890 RepID=A0A5S9IQ55_UABAM|nr:50S ribosomal protein L16 [Candidatus Uabimicrobium amorphum]